ncbi:olfactory receptor 5B12-like [Dendropsophus ebraccatus]|uniref:olfactory receptor 5B12-like n=1 Tax=Dendropsophus ebraccatus TaxID=150705 RepID=UPI0038320719
MKPNQTVTYFIMKGLSDDPKLQAPIFVLVLLIYLIVLFGNMGLLLLICLESHLHTPMYFFLGNLSIVDMMSCTITLHKTLQMFITGDNTVSYLACMVEFYMFEAVIALEVLVLTTMSFDRYVAICRPLNYKIIMNYKICLLLASFCWLFSFLHYIPQGYVAFRISCFTTNVIDHFFCDLVPLVEIICPDSLKLLRLLTNTEGLIVYNIAPFLLTLTSYIFIIRAIMKIGTSIGRRKAFYTCSSHLIVNTLLYTSFILQYYIPSNVLGSKKIFSLFNTVILSLLNPFLYSIRNEDIKIAFRRRIEKCSSYTFFRILGNVIGMRKEI